MGVRILYDSAEDKACMYDSVTGHAFGPIFDSHDSIGDADQTLDNFIQWFANSHEVTEDDPRICSDDLLESYQSKYLSQL